MTPAAPPTGEAASDRATRFPDPSSIRDLRLLAGIIGLAFLVRLLPVLRGGGLYGLNDYDDGVYFGAALALVHGLIPFRDFLLLHPPGIVYLLAPFAALSDVFGDPTAFAAARVGFMALGALNTGLVLLVAGRLGRRVALLAGLLYAVWPVAVSIERTTWLIAPQNTLLLLALLALGFGGDVHAPVPGIRRAALGGVAVGLAFSTQIWGAVPGAILLGWLALRTRHGNAASWRPVTAYVLAAATATALAWAPFLLASGSRMVRFIVFDQFNREKATGSMVTRLRALEGLPAAVPAALVVVAFLVVVSAAIWAAWRRPEMLPWVIMASAQVVVIAVAPPFLHYAGWVAPAGAVVIGGTVDTLLGRRGASSRFRLAFSVGCAGVIGALLLISSVRGLGTPIAVPRLQTAIAGARCVTADSPVLLIELDLLSRDVRAGCALLLDPNGTSHDLDRASNASRVNRPEYQAAIAAYYRSGEAALFMGLQNGDGLSAATMASIRARLPVTTVVGPVTVMAAH